MSVLETLKPALKKLVVETVASTPEVRAACRPRALSTGHQAQDPVVPYARFCAVYKLSTLLEMSPSISDVLEKPVDGPKRTEKDVAAVQAYFNPRLINELVSKKTFKAKKFPNLISDYVALPLPERSRASLWAAASSTLSLEELQNEICSFASTLRALDPGADSRACWRKAIEAALRASTEHATEVRHDIGRLIDAAEKSTDPLSYLLDWAEGDTPPSHLGPPIREAVGPSKVNIGLTASAAVWETIHVSPDATSTRINGYRRGRSTIPTAFFERGAPTAEPKLNGSYSLAHAATVTEENPGEGEPTTTSPVALAGANGGLVVQSAPRAAWLLQQSVDRAKLDLASAQLSAAAQRLAEALKAIATPADYLNAVGIAMHAQRELARCVDGLPSEGQVNERAVRAQQALDRVGGLTEADVDALLSAGASSDDLVEVGPLVSSVGRLKGLPTWFWDGHESAPQCLLKPENRARAQRLPWDDLEACDLEPALSYLGTLLPPAAGESAFEWGLAQLVAWAAHQRTLRSLPSAVRTWLDEAPTEGNERELRRAAIDRVLALRPQLNPKLFGRICDDLVEADAGEGITSIGTVETAVAKLGDKALTATNVLSLVSQAERVVARPVEAAPPPEIEARFEHDFTIWLSATRKTAPLVFVPYTPGRTRPPRKGAEPTGYVRAPVILRSSAEVPLRIVAEVKGNEHASAPEYAITFCHLDDGELISTYRELLTDTRKLRHVRTFSIKVPLRQVPSNLEVMLRAVHPTTGEVLATGELSWPDITEKYQPAELDWAEAPEPEYVQEQPVGAQKQRQDVERRINAKNSFGIIAPRRFGKTTFLSYIEQSKALIERGNVVLPAINCQNFFRGASFRDRELWEHISEAFNGAPGVERTLQTKDGFDGHPRPLPTPVAFERARRAARQNNKAAIVLLLDEAQLYFAGPYGVDLGRRLRSLLADSIGKSTPELAPVLLGVAGLPSLNQQRIGTDLYTFLGLGIGTDASDKLSDEDVEALVRARTKGNLYSTKEARHSLATVCDNLHVLRVFFEQTLSRITTEHRLWVSYDDVVDVELRICNSLKEGRENAITPFVKDLINDGEHPDVWKPSPEYPVALALAQAWRDAPREQPSPEQLSQLLEGWCRAQYDREVARPSFSRERVEQHLRTLRERRVIDERLSFRSKFFQSWLEGTLGQLSHGRDEAFKAALFRGGVARLTLPEDCDAAGKGAQAEVVRFEAADGRPMAARRAKLRDEKAKERFLESVKLLSRLQNARARTSTGDVGWRHIFQVEEIGLSAANDDEGVHIYRWIEGHDLHDRCKKLSAAAVVDIGEKLAAALALLHKHEIVHRDIRPANIILEAGTNEPVLIDFGVARAFSDDSRTSFDSPFTPTEVRLGESGWGPEGDIYSLGKTLDELLAPNDRQRSIVYRRMIAPCLDVRHRRPSAQQLVGLLEQLSLEINLNATKHEAERRIDELVRADINHTWYWNRLVQMKFQKAFTSMALGVHPDVWDKLPHFADFLNQILEAAPPPFNEGYGSFGRLNLTLLCSEQPLPGERARLRQRLLEVDPNRRALDALNALRNDRSHGGRGSDRAERAIRLFRDLASSTQAARVCALFEAAGHVLGLSSPSLLAREFLTPTD